MELLRCKARLAVLWIFLAVGMSEYMFLTFMEPGVLEGIIAGEIDGMQIDAGVLLFYSIFWTLPLIMAWLSLTLKGSANRWTSFVLGILLAIFCVMGLVESSVGGRSVAIMINYILGAVFAALIAWYAWRLPIQEA